MSKTIQASVSPSLQFDDSNPITSRLELSAEGGVSTGEFEVEVDISHTWRSDVVIELEAPSGKRITLRRVKAEDSGDNVKGAYPTNLRSLTPFSELAGEALSGAWTLHVSDQYAGDEGVLNSWGITQRQYVFSARGTTSPVAITGLPNGESYACGIAGVYSEVTPSRQSRTVEAGNVELEARSVTSNAEATFLNLLRSIVGLKPSGGPNDNLSQARPTESGGKEDAQINKADSAPPKMIPTMNIWALTSLVFLTALFACIRLKPREAGY